MKTENQESLLKKSKFSILTSIFLVIAILIYLWRLYDLGISGKDVFFYEKRELMVKHLEALTDELNSAEVEGVFVIRKKDSRELDATLYSRSFLSGNVGGNPSINELLLQLGSGSGNAYAKSHNCKVLIYEGQVFKYCP